MANSDLSSYSFPEPLGKSYCFGEQMTQHQDTY